MILSLSASLPGFLFGWSVFFSYLGMCHPQFISMGVQSATIPVYGCFPTLPCHHALPQGAGFYYDTLSDSIRSQKESSKHSFPAPTSS